MTTVQGQKVRQFKCGMQLNHSEYKPTHDKLPQNGAHLGSCDVTHLNFYKKLMISRKQYKPDTVSMKHY